MLQSLDEVLENLKSQRVCEAQTILEKCFKDLMKSRGILSLKASKRIKQAWKNLNEFLMFLTILKQVWKYLKLPSVSLTVS